MSDSDPTLKYHKFKTVTFTSPTSCSNCQEFIWGVYKQGSECQVCGYAVHKGCLSKSQAKSICSKQHSGLREVKIPEGPMEGMVYLQVIEATKLYTPGHGSDLSSSSEELTAKEKRKKKNTSFPDPFCAVKFNKDKDQKHTETQRKTTEPVWNGNFPFLSKDPMNDMITIKVWGDRTIIRNDFLGKVKIPVSAFLYHEIDEWLPLLDKSISRKLFINLYIQEWVLTTHHISFKTKQMPRAKRKPKKNGARFT